MPSKKQYMNETGLCCTGVTLYFRLELLTSYYNRLYSWPKLRVFAVDTRTRQTFKILAPGGYWMCCPNGLLFHQKSLDMGPILVNKSIEEGPISQNLWRNCKMSSFWSRKTFRNGSSICKNFKKTVYSAIFE